MLFCPPPGKKSREKKWNTEWWSSEPGSLAAFHSAFNISFIDQQNYYNHILSCVVGSIQVVFATQAPAKIPLGSARRRKAVCCHFKLLSTDNWEVKSCHWLRRIKHQSNNALLLTVKWRRNIKEQLSVDHAIDYMLHRAEIFNQRPVLKSSLIPSSSCS